MRIDWGKVWKRFDRMWRDDPNPYAEWKDQKLWIEMIVNDAIIRSRCRTTTRRAGSK